MKPGELRRFQDDAFFGSEKHRNGQVFLVVSCEQRHLIDILVDGDLDAGWSQQVIEDMSEVLSESR